MRNMPTLQQKSGSETPSNVPDAALEQQQRRRMMVALAVLLLALIAVLIKDRQFWFPSGSSSESDTAEDVPSSSSHPSLPAKTSTEVTSGKAAVPISAARTKTSKKRAAAIMRPSSASDAPIITTTNRAVLPPLEVEVVAGGQHRTINPKDGPVKVEMQPESASVEQDSDPPAAAPAPSGVKATAQVQLSPGAAQVVTRQVSPDYPLLAKQMKVQGAVVLEVLIGKNGGIQDIQVVSGPAILSAAAREAVKQWHFKPYYQAGVPVETEARITVNFTISTY
jgi:TonB family protein